MSVRNTVKSIQDIMRQDAGVDGDAQRLSQLCWMFFLKIIDDQDQQLEVMQDHYRSPIPMALQWRTWAADPEGITGDALLTFVNNELFPNRHGNLFPRGKRQHLAGKGIHFQLKPSGNSPPACNFKGLFDFLYFLAFVAELYGIAGLHQERWDADLFPIHQKMSIANELPRFIARRGKPESIYHIVKHGTVIDR